MGRFLGAPQLDAATIRTLLRRGHLIEGKSLCDGVQERAFFVKK
jgi:hypothetical protein